MSAEVLPRVRAFTQLCVISITDRLVIWTELRSSGVVPSQRPISADRGIRRAWVSWLSFHPSVVWIVFSRAVRVKGFSRRVMPRFNTSRSAISSPV